MLNPFKVYALAADARRADKLLGDGFPKPSTLHDKVKFTLARLEAARGAMAAHRSRADHYSDELAVANAKIAKMQSGLKRGTTPKRGPEVSA